MIDNLAWDYNLDKASEILERADDKWRPASKLSCDSLKVGLVNVTNDTAADVLKHCQAVEIAVRFLGIFVLPCFLPVGMVRKFSLIKIASRDADLVLF